LAGGHPFKDRSRGRIEGSCKTRFAELTRSREPPHHLPATWSSVDLAYLPHPRGAFSNTLFSRDLVDEM
jgi:hypothetical protein